MTLPRTTELCGYLPAAAGPGVLDHLAIGKADAAGFAVDLLDADADRLAFLHDLAGMLDAAPRQLADVQQAIDAVAQLDKGPKIHQLSHRAFVDLAGSERLEEVLLLLLLLAFQHGPAAEHEVLPRGIGVGDQAGEPLADELGQVFHPVQRNLAHGDEAANVIDFALQPAGVVAGDLDVDEHAFVDFVPVAQFHGHAGQGQIVKALFGVEPLDDDFDGVARLGRRLKRTGGQAALLATAELDEDFVCAARQRRGRDAATPAPSRLPDRRLRRRTSGRPATGRPWPDPTRLPWWP